MTWKEWCASDECIKVLERCALVIKGRLQRTGSLSVISSVSGSDFSADDVKDELVSRIWEWVCGNSDKLEKKHPFESLSSHGIRAIMNVILHTCWFLVCDEVRRKDPFKRLYSRIRSVLSSSDSGIKTFSHKNSTYYTLEKNAKYFPGGCYVHTEEDYSSWNMPPFAIHSGNITKQNIIEQVAAFFWDEVRKNNPDVTWIPVRELAKYITSIVPQVTEVSFVEEPDREEGDFEDGSGWTTVPPDLEPLSFGNRKEQELLVGFRLKELAQKCSAQFSDEEKKLICLLFKEGKTLQEIASELNLKSPSNVSYWKDKLFEKIRRFCSHWPGLSPPDLNKEIFNQFIWEVINVCEKKLNDF